MGFGYEEKNEVKARGIRTPLDLLNLDSSLLLITTKI